MAAPVNTYELTYIVNAVLSDQQIKDVVARISRFLQDNGAEILESNEWGTRRLAYPIRKKRNGYYVNLFFRSTGDLIARLERALEIDDDILRYLTLRLDTKMIRYHEQQAGKAARLAETLELGPGVEEEEEFEEDEEHE